MEQIPKSVVTWKPRGTSANSNCRFQEIFCGPPEFEIEISMAEKESPIILEEVLQGVQFKKLLKRFGFHFETLEKGTDYAEFELEIVLDISQDRIACISLTHIIFPSESISVEEVSATFVYEGESFRQVFGVEQECACTPDKRRKWFWYRWFTRGQPPYSLRNYPLSFRRILFKLHVERTELRSCMESLCYSCKQHLVPPPLPLLPIVPPTYPHYLFSPKFSDVEVWASGKAFRCHGLILAEASPFFSRMFDHPTKEADEGRILLPDVHPNIWTQFLQFVYTQRCDCLDAADVESLIPLYQLADRFLVDDLKCRAAKAMMEGAGEETILELWELAKVQVELFEPLRKMCWKKWNLATIDGNFREVAKRFFPILRCPLTDNCNYCQLVKLN